MRNFRGPRPVQVAFGMIDRGRWRPAMRLTPIVAALLIAPSMVLAQADTNPPSPEQQPGQTERPEAPVPTLHGPPAPHPPPAGAAAPRHIGTASCRAGRCQSGWISAVAGHFKQK